MFAIGMRCFALIYLMARDVCPIFSPTITLPEVCYNFYFLHFNYFSHQPQLLRKYLIISSFPGKTDHPFSAHKLVVKFKRLFMIQSSSEAWNSGTTLLPELHSWFRFQQCRMLWFSVAIYQTHRKSILLYSLLSMESNLFRLEFDLFFLFMGGFFLPHPFLTRPWHTFMTFWIYICI